MVPKTLTNIDGLTSLPFVILPKIIILSPKKLLLSQNSLPSLPTSHLPSFESLSFLPGMIYRYNRSEKRYFLYP